MLFSQPSSRLSSSHHGDDEAEKNERNRILESNFYKKSYDEKIDKNSDKLLLPNPPNFSKNFSVISVEKEKEEKKEKGNEKEKEKEEKKEKEIDWNDSIEKKKKKIIGNNNFNNNNDNNISNSYGNGSNNEYENGNEDCQEEDDDIIVYPEIQSTDLVVSSCPNLNGEL